MEAIDMAGRIDYVREHFPILLAWAAHRAWYRVLLIVATAMIGGVLYEQLNGPSVIFHIPAPPAPIVQLLPTPQTPIPGPSAPPKIVYRDVPVGDPAAAKKRQEIRDALGKLETQGLGIKDGCLEKRVAATCEEEANNWYNDTLAYIRMNLEPSYSDRFLAASGQFLMYNAAGNDQKLNGIVNTLIWKGDKLEEFIKELLN